jgi:hypothetical protein
MFERRNRLAFLLPVWPIFVERWWGGCCGHSLLEFPRLDMVVVLLFYMYNCLLCRLWRFPPWLRGGSGSGASSGWPGSRGVVLSLLFLLLLSAGGSGSPLFGSYFSPPLLPERLEVRV